MKNAYFQEGLFESFQKHRENIALDYGARAVTYRELDKKSSYIANLIMNSGVKPGSFIGIYLHDRVDLIMVMIAIIKTGSVFVPLDPVLPIERIKTMLHTCEVRYLFLDSKTSEEKLHIGNGSHNKFHTFVIDDNFYEKYDYLEEISNVIEYSPEDPMYIYFTSGSSGAPKAILGKNKSLLHFIEWEVETFNVDESFRVSQLMIPAFDAFLKDLFVPLFSGARVCIPANIEIILDSIKIVEWVEKKEITLVHCVPSLFKLINRPDLTQAGVQNLKYILLSGERVKPRELSNWYERMSGRVQLVNLYGPTETTLIKTCYFITQDDIHKQNIPVGIPMKGCQVFIMDQDLNFCGKNMVGEIFIRTPYRTFGYYNDPELNKTHFIPNPVNGDQNDLLYRTGDLGRILPDGNLELIGRIDRQIKVRGMRIELQEIEHVLDKHAAVKESIVSGREDKNGDPFLCAYVISNKNKEDENPSLIQNIREYLSRLLPDAMVPAFIVPLETFPLTPNGKVDVNALPDPVSEISTEYCPPQNELQRKLVETWSRVLGLKQERIGIDSSFFDLGGHSLKVTILTAQIHKDFSVRLPLKRVFDTPTIRELAEYISTAEEEICNPIILTEDREYYPASPAQKRFYLLQQMDLQSTAYNIPQVVELEGEPEVGRFEDIFTTLIRRHEGFRTSFIMLAGTPVQRTLRIDNIDFEIEHYSAVLEPTPPFGHLRASPEEGISRRGSAHKLQWVIRVNATKRSVLPLSPCVPPSMRTESNVGEGDLIRKFIRPFDLSQAPLLRVGLIKIDEEKYILIVDMHHIISDGLSHGILIEDFSYLYNKEPLFSLKLRYRDYSQWQNKKLKVETGIMAKQEAYWLEEFAVESPRLDLPTDFLRPKVMSFSGSSSEFDIGKNESDALKKIAHEEEATLYMILLSLFNILLAKLSNREEIIIGTPTAGRRHADLHSLIGPFINTLTLKNYPAGSKSYIQFLREVKTRSLSAFENQDYQFEDLVEKVSAIRDAGRNPLFDVMFVLQNIESNPTEVQGLKLKPGATKNRTAKFDLTIIAVESQEGVHINLEYSTKLFYESTIKRFINYFHRIVAEVIKDSGKKISAIEIIDIEEKKKLLFEINETRSAYPKEKTIYELFYIQAQKKPDHIAVIGKDHDVSEKTQEVHLSYRELNHKAEQIGIDLTAKGVNNEAIVGFMADRSLAMIAGIFGILHAGCAYLPIDLNYPRERIRYMLRDSCTRLLITTRALYREFGGIFEGLSIEIVFIEKNGITEGASCHPGAAPLIKSFDQTFSKVWPPAGATTWQGINPEANGLAYVIYTSGTTGKPKGNLTTHSNVIRVVKNTNYIDIKDDDRILQLSNYAFDGSVFDIYGALLNGAALILVDRDEICEIEKLSNLISGEKITVFFVTTALFNTLLDIDIACLKNVRRILFGGERVSVQHCQRALQYLGKDRIIHVYGPTETTVYASYYFIDRIGNDDYTIPIGKPIANTALYVLDKNRALVPMGIKGELYIGGDGLARGYLNRPELTAEKFKECSFKRHTSYKTDMSYSSEKLYSTGDLARWLTDGNIEFMGRIDHQVKIRGFRIELGEIESQLLKHEAVLETLVTAIHKEKGDKFLCAYIVTEKPVELQELREYLSRDLPDYMIPYHFVSLDDMPLNLNGKIDKKALPEPAASSGKAYTPPKDETEKKLIDIFRKVLSNIIDKEDLIGIDDNFFTIGGHSLKAAHLIAVIHKKMDVKVPLTEVFRTPTVRELAAYIRRSETNRFKTIDEAEKKEFYKCSSTQKRFYIMQQLETDTTGYNMPIVQSLAHDIQIEKLEEVFLKLIDRHESLRTSFEIIAGEPVQRIHRPGTIDFKIEYPDVGTRRAVPFDQEHKGSARFCVPPPMHPIGVREAVNRFVRPFDLSRAPLLRVGIIKTGAVDPPILMVDMHHIITDGLSQEILVAEFMELYDGKKCPNLRLQYRDFSEWRNSKEQQAALKRQEEYWLKEFREKVPLLNLHTDFPRSGVRSHAGESYEFKIEKDQAQALRSISSIEECTLYMLLFSLYSLMLSKLSGQEDIVVGTAVAGRGHRDLENIIGLFFNTLPIRSYPRRRQVFVEYLRDFKMKVLDAFENQDYALDNLVETLLERHIMSREPGRNPIFDTMFAMQSVQKKDDKPRLPEQAAGPETRSESFKYEAKVAKFDLLFNVVENPGNIEIKIDYSTALFKRATIEQIAGYYIEIISQVIEDRRKKLEDIRISGELSGVKLNYSQEDYTGFEF